MLVVEKKAEKEKVTYVCNHRDYSGGYKEETNKRYCKEGYDHKGIYWKNCNIIFG